MKQFMNGHPPKIIGMLIGLIAFAGVLLAWIDVDTMAAEEGQEITVLFTHDIHSYLEPKDDGTGEKYGIARLKTTIDELRSQNETTLLVDAGDFSMGTLYQTLFYRRSSGTCHAWKIGI